MRKLFLGILLLGLAICEDCKRRTISECLGVCECVVCYDIYGKIHCLDYVDRFNETMCENMAKQMTKCDTDHIVGTVSIIILFILLPIVFLIYIMAKVMLMCKICKSDENVAGKYEWAGEAAGV
jgi:hypothetical protein